jgi:hypothetical protein
VLLFKHWLILYTRDSIQNGAKDVRRDFAGLLTLAVIISIIALLAGAAVGQAAPKPKRLHAPATVRGLVGGESHDAYVVRVPHGRSLSVEISWRSEDNNTASFGVGTSADFEPVTFGKESADGKKWVGKVPRTGDYFIEVVAHPSAHYVLKVTIK